MVIIVQYEELKELLEANIDANLVDNSVLDTLGYYTNRDSWIAGVQIKKLHHYIRTNLQDPTKAAQNS